jgi:hypothetical protein
MTLRFTGYNENVIIARPARQPPEGVGARGQPQRAV